MALVELESALCENNNTRSVVRIMNAVKILDPTFSPPVINMHCAWQKRFIFNSGFVTARLIGLSPEAALTVAVATSGFYVRTAVSPTLDELAEFIGTW